MGLVITINGRMGAITHAPFPILARMPFGYYFSYFVVLSRCVLAIVWLGYVLNPMQFANAMTDSHCSVQTTTGGQCMSVLLTAKPEKGAHKIREYIFQHSCGSTFIGPVQSKTNGRLLL